MTEVNTTTDTEQLNLLKTGASKIRQSNIELCRIICMLLIIAHHSVIHGGAIGMNTCLNRYLAFFLVPGGKLCFVTFMVISTWFLVDGKFKLERFVKTWLQVLLYSVIFAGVSVILGAHLTGRNWFSVFFPISGNSHGFAATYLAFYLLLPFLGMITQNIKKRGLAFLIIILFYFQVISKVLAIINQYNLPILSSELTLFVLFYFISLWLKRYPIAITNNKIAMFGTFLVVWFGVFGIWCSSITNFAKTPIYAGLASLSSDESSFLYILGGYALFFAFKNLTIPTNKTINYVAHAAFGVLLFHDHNFFRYVLWKNVLKAPDWYYRNTFIIWIIVCVIGIYLFGLAMETVRQHAEKYIFSSTVVKETILKAENYLGLSSNISPNNIKQKTLIREENLQKQTNRNINKIQSSDDVRDDTGSPNKRLYVIFFVLALVCFSGIMFFLYKSANSVLVARFISIKKLVVLGVAGVSLFFPFIYFIQNKFRPSWYKFTFYSVMLFFIGFIFAVGYITRGESIRTILADDPHDALMDFFNSIQYGLKPYAAKVIYPPLINVFYGLLGRFTIIGKGGTYALRENQLGMLVFGTYIIAVYSSFIYCINKFKDGLVSEKIIFTFVILFSLPFLYLFDRANSIIMVVIALMIFSSYHQSDSKKLQIFAFVALGVAAGIKIAPAIYGAVLLREKRFKDAFIAFVIGVVIFVVPFVLTDGNPAIMMHNIAYTTGLMQGVMTDPTTGLYRLTGNGHYLNTLNTTAFLGRLFNFNGLNVAEFLNGCILLFGTALVVFTDKIAYWKAWAILTCIVILYPGFSAIYNLAYMVIPLMLFLDSRPKMTKLNFIYMIFFLLLFIPFVNIKVPFLKMFFNDWHPLTLMTTIQSLSLLLMTILLLSDGIIVAYKYQIKNASSKLKVSSSILILAILVGIYGWKCGFTQRAVDSFYPYNLKLISSQHGLSLYEGQYVWTTRKTDFLLNTGKIYKEGLIINLVNADDKINALDKWNELKVFINDTLILTTDNIKQNGLFVYIEPQKIKQVAQGKTMRVCLERDGNKESHYLQISYIGPANLNDKLTFGTPFQNASEGFHIYDDNNLWMASEAQTLLKANDIVKKGLIVTVQAPKVLLDANENKEIKLNVLADNKIIKTIDIDDVNEKTIAIDPQELPNQVKQNDDDDETIPLKIELKTNALFNSRKMDLDVNNDDRSLIVKYIGACDSLPLGRGVQISKNKHFYFNADELDGEDLNIIYKLLPNSFVNEEKIILDVMLDGQKVYQRLLKKNDYDCLHAINISNDMIAKTNRITELEIAITGLTRGTNNVMSIPYIGKNQLVSKLTDKPSAKFKDYHLVTSGLEYDKTTNGWMMGHTAEMIFPSELVAKGIKIQYKVPKELFLANKESKDISLTVLINGKKIKSVPIVEQGSFEIFLSSDELQEIVNSGDFCFNIKLHVNAAYNLQKLKISHQNIYRSIAITYLGVY